MKQAKVMFTAILALGIVGGALAFKAKKFFVPLYTCAAKNATAPSFIFSKTTLAVEPSTTYYTATLAGVCTTTAYITAE